MTTATLRSAARYGDQGIPRPWDSHPSSRCPPSADDARAASGIARQFQERVVQVRFDRADREELRRRDLLVREAVRGERGDAALRLGELVGCGTSTADARQLVTRPLRPQPRSERLEARHGLLERLARRPASLRETLVVAECQHGARPLERVRRRLVVCQRLAEGEDRGCVIATRRREQPRQRAAPMRAQRFARAAMSSYRVR